MPEALELIKLMPQAFDSAKAPGMNATIQFQLSRPMHARIAGGACEVEEGQAENPDVTVKVKDEDLVNLLSGRLSGVMAFMTGRLRVKGDTSLARKALAAFDLNRIK